MCFGVFIDLVVDKVLVVMVLILIIEYYYSIWIIIFVVIMIVCEIIILVLCEWMVEIGKWVSVVVLWVGKVKILI